MEVNLFFISDMGHDNFDPLCCYECPTGIVVYVRYSLVRDIGTAFDEISEACLSLHFAAPCALLLRLDLRSLSYWKPCLVRT